MALLYKGDAQRGHEWQQLFAQHAPDIEFRQWPEIGNPEEVRYLLAWQAPEALSECLPALEVLFATSAGVDQFDDGAVPADLPVVRMLDPAIKQGMLEYATFATLWAHRHMARYVAQQQAGHWQPHRLVPTPERRVGVLGLGQLGGAIAYHLAEYGFQVSGWSRQRHQMSGIQCFAGQEELGAFLAASDILVCVLPLTDATRGILARPLFEQLPNGATVINIGRGEHLVEEDLLACLEERQLAGAVMDVLRQEPAAADHPFWQDPRILLTPHIAAMTQPVSAFPMLLGNIRRHQRGEAMGGLVSRKRGY